MADRADLSPEKMQVVVLMGGLGTRLRGAVGELPKAMAPVVGKPFFRHQLDLLKLYGFRKFLFLIGHGGGAVRGYFGNGRKFGVRIGYSDEGFRPLGTLGALRRALPSLEKDFALIYGDSFMDVNYRELVYAYEAARRDERKMLMAVLHNRGRFGPSNVVYREGGIVVYDKKRHHPGMEYIDYGVSLISRDVVRRIRPGHPCDLARLYGPLARKGLVAGHPVGNRFYEIGSPASLEECAAYLGRRALRHPAVFLDRDGVLNAIVPNSETGSPDSPLDVGEVRILPRAAKALAILRKKGYLLIVVTNQPAAAKGKATLEQLAAINGAVREKLASAGALLDDLLMCPHHPAGSPGTRHPSLIGRCRCRKPSPGLLRLAARKWRIDIGRSYMVGDSPTDILAASRFGVRSVFVGNCRCDTDRLLAGRKPDIIAADLYEFAKRAG
jgi:histidinol-phosphate phosphatase family protein